MTKNRKIKKLPLLKKLPLATFFPHIIAIALLAFIAAAYFTGEIAIGQSSFSFHQRSLSPDAAGQKAKKFITEQILRGGDAKVSDVQNKGDVFSFKIEIPKRGTFTSYVTKDGRFVFPSGYDLKATEKKKQKQTKPTTKIPKTDKPTVSLFVMSFCPYGNQAEDLMAPVVNLLKKDATIDLHYIVSKNGQQYDSLHGKQEAHEDVRELCVNKYQPNKLWPFVEKINKDCTPQNADTCWVKAARAVGVNVNQISRCQKNEGNSLLDKEIALTQKYSISGSPTLIINGGRYQGERTSEGYKKAICSAFNKQPKECSTVLGKTAKTKTSGSCR